MSRSAPIYDAGTIPASGGGNVTLWRDKIIEKLTEFQSNGEDAWELADQIDTGVDYEAVFHSVGDRTLGSGGNIGDTDIWLWIHQRSVDDFVLRTSQDYSPTTGNWAGGSYRPAGTADFATNVSQTQAIDWFSICNEYEFIFIWNQGGTWKVISIGALIRPYSAALNGVARITSQSGTGNGVTIGTDRDISGSLEPGQGVWLLNQTPDGVGIQSVGIDLVTVVSATSNTVVVDGVVGTFAVGSLIGFDPCPVYNKTTATSQCYFSQQLDGTYTTETAESGATVNPLLAILTESHFDPGPDNLYYGGQPFVKMNAQPAGFRGKHQHARIFTLGLEVDEDLMEVDFDSAQRWKVFISTNATWFSQYATGYGPGAS